MQDIDKKQARELLIKTKVYRVFAGVFAVFGLLVFLTIYTQVYQADFMRALHDPYVIVFFIFPFIPAIILSMRAKKAGVELQKLVAPEKPT